MKQRTDAPSTELTLNRDNPAVNKALIELVGLLARRSARKWYHQQVEAHRRDREASQTLNADAGRRTGGDAPKKPPKAQCAPLIHEIAGAPKARRKELR